MHATEDIRARHEERRRAGLDLGAAVGPETDAGAKGRVQVFEHGRIYWHRDTGAHDVHGRVLALYLQGGGPDRLGFPTADQGWTEDSLHPAGRFEHGDILLVEGTEGVSISDPFRAAWRRCGGELGSLLLPLTMPIAVAGGEAVYFERGCLWRGPQTDGRIAVALFDPPLLGRPALVTRQQEAFCLRRFIRWQEGSVDPELLARVWQDRLALRRVRASAADEEVALLPQAGEQGGIDLRLAGGPVGLRERGLYDLVVRLAGNQSFPAAPHSFYVKSSWEQFGFIHATDIHVARRIEGLQARLDELACADPAMAAAKAHFVNFNDSFRDLIRYANRLHDLGLLDLILATGDLVDYGFETADQRHGASGGNYALLEALVRGRAVTAGGAPGEELRVPIYTLFGNHDHRIRPYDLLYETRAAGGLSRRPERLYAPFDLLEDEAFALQGGIPIVPMSQALASLAIDRANTGGSYAHYRRRINDQASYVLKLGAHRVVMIDAGPDAGLPAAPLPFYLRYLTGTLSSATRQLLSGRPNLEGFDDEHLALLRGTLAEASAEAIVVVGVHGPPINIRGSEFAPYLRETQRAGADPRQLIGYVLRQASPAHGRSLLGRLNPFADGDTARIEAVIHGRSEEALPDRVWDRLAAWVEGHAGHGRWLDGGGSHFLAGSPDDLLKDGVTDGATEAFLKLCTGIDAARPVDLVLCGHAHDRVEYRIAWDEAAQELRYFMDFYLENPRTYYSYREAGVAGRIHLQIDYGAAPDERIRQAHDERYEPPLPFKLRAIPPFAEPLNGATSPRSWWQTYRPLIVETAPLGPMDRSQRAELGVRPDPSFVGFRLFQVERNTIDKGRYVTLEELRAHHFVMPFEDPAREVAERICGN